MTAENKALVLLSGGQDSTTCLAWALNKFDYVETIGFAYGQRHDAEIVCRREVLKLFRGEKLGADHLVPINTMQHLRTVPPASIAGYTLPPTFVPGRNLMFFTAAAALAYRRGLRHLVGGMCETDYSGYPDCRDDTLKALQVTLNLGMEQHLVIHTPLMRIDKAQTWEMARGLGGDTLVEFIKEHTHTCYNNDREHRHPWGYGCAACPACDLRAKGFEKWSAGRV